MANECRPPSAVIQLCSKISPLAVDWLKNRIMAHRSQGGCQLHVDEFHDEVHVLYVSASKDRLLIGAETMGLRKEYKDGTIKDFCVKDRQNFKHFMDEKFLLESEQQQIVKAELDDLRAREERYIPGHSNVKLYRGKCIVGRMQSEGLITSYFPLHNRLMLNVLKQNWYGNTDLAMSVPLDRIHAYFGDTVAFYFAFLNFYTLALIPLVGVCCLHFILGGFASEANDNWFISIAHVIWSVCFLEFWKRKSVEYAYNWGSFDVKIWERPRTGFRGELGLNEITQTLEPMYPMWKRYMQVYLVSVPIVAGCMFVSVLMMYYYLSWEEYALRALKGNSSHFALILSNVPSSVYSLVMIIYHNFYIRLAERLTYAENHRLERAHQKYLITKILFFDFVNNFLILFYIAFVLSDMQMLRTTLRNLLLVQIVVEQIIEALIPWYVFGYLRKKKSRSKNKADDQVGEATSDHSILGWDLTCCSARDEQTQRELGSTSHPGMFDEYLKMWQQFGYVMLFACAYPPASFLALINNFIEQRSDAFKNCQIFRRPFSHRTDGIGAWQTAFEVMSYLSIITNLALIFNSPNFMYHFGIVFPGSTVLHVFIAFMIVEHAVLSLRYAVGVFIPQTPRWIKVAIGRYKFEAAEALKKERMNASQAHVEKEISKGLMDMGMHHCPGMVSKSRPDANQPDYEDDVYMENQLTPKNIVKQPKRRGSRESATTPTPHPDSRSQRFGQRAQGQGFGQRAQGQGFDQRTQGQGFDQGQGRQGMAFDQGQGQARGRGQRSPGQQFDQSSPGPQFAQGQGQNPRGNIGGGGLLRNFQDRQRANRQRLHDVDDDGVDGMRRRDVDEPFRRTGPDDEVLLSGLDSEMGGRASVSLSENTNLVLRAGGPNRRMTTSKSEDMMLNGKDKAD